MEVFFMQILQIFLDRKNNVSKKQIKAKNDRIASELQHMVALEWKTEKPKTEYS